MSQETQKYQSRLSWYLLARKESSNPTDWEFSENRLFEFLISHFGKLLNEDFYMELWPDFYNWLEVKAEALK